ncbi:MAG: primosomal protein N' [Betaproteobacteria bacterium]|nr:primosomal protein N' [Betaproteobacteria bacterium]
MGPVVQIALDVPLDQCFDFLAPGATAQDIGQLAVVPFGKRKTTGVILGVANTSTLDPAQLKPVDRVMRDVPAFAPRDLALMRFLAGYYQHPLGQVLMSCLPPALRNERAPVAVAALVTRHVALSPAGEAFDAASLPTRAIAQRRVLQALQVRPETRAALVVSIPGAAQALKALTQKGLVKMDVVAPTIPDPLDAASTLSPALIPAQSTAVNRIRENLDRFRTFLLFGITGSGKSEVYLQSVAACLARGRQALILVPEVHLTPQLAARFRIRFPGVHMAVLHSHAASRERLKDWLAAQAGHARIVLGTRLAVTTPMPELGLIIVDEEHDTSFKQQEGLRYSARDAAVYRGSLAACPVVLGSATPSLESWRNAQPDGESDGRYELLTLPERAVPGAKLPAVRVINSAHEPQNEGLGGTLIAALKQRLARREQSLVFINRRGFAPALVCAQCAWMPECGHCSARMVFHRGQSPNRPDHPGRLHCHHCGETRPVPTHCGDCGSVELAPLGRGTQRVEETLAGLFPAARVARLDRDAARAKGVATRIFAEAAAGDVDILVGTQMLSKGHDFPNLTLVGVLNADDAMFSADFRAPERLFAQLVQVAGRAGRAGLPGEVLIQTRFPTHPLYAAVCAQDYPGFAKLQDDERRLAGLPPHAALALLRVEGRKPGEAMKAAKAAATLARALTEARGKVHIHDALPAALAKKGGWERAQVLVQSPSRTALHRLLAPWRAVLAAELPRQVRWALDVDPMEV